MPLQYNYGPNAVINDEASLTEQEWKDSCDINKMIRGALKGAIMNGSPNPAVFGYDDTTLDGVTHRINLQKSHEAMEKLSKEELEPLAYENIPDHIRKKFKLRKKSPPSPASETPAPTSQDATAKTSNP